MRRPWIVTGGAGFIGFHVCRRLVAEGIDVVALDNLSPYYDPGLKKARLAELINHPCFTFEHADLADECSVAPLFARYEPEVVIHLAAQAGVRYSIEDPRSYVRSNVVGTLNVLEECRRRSVEHLVYASSSSVYGAGSTPFSVHGGADHPLNVYASTKRSTELLAHSYSNIYELPTTGLRFFTVYGPWGRPDMAYFAFATAMVERRPIVVYGSGAQRRDFTYVDDVVEGIVRVAGTPATCDPAWSTTHPDPATSFAPYRIYNIGHGEQVSIDHLIELLEWNLGVTAIREERPAEPGDAKATHADVVDLEQAIGLLPSTSIDQGLAAFTDWFRGYRG